MRFLAFLVSFFSLIPSADAAGYHVNPATSAVTFTAIGSPGFLRINGEGGKVSGDSADRKHAVFTVNLDDFKTGIDLRDHHMKEKYLDTAKYPKAELAVDLPDAAGPVAGADFKGKLTLHGVTKDVAGKVSLWPLGDGIRVEATIEIALPDFKIDIPSYLGVTVAETVEIKVALKADKT